MLGYKAVFWSNEDVFLLITFFYISIFFLYIISLQHVFGVVDEYHSLSPFLWAEGDPVFTRQDSNRSEKETVQVAHETEPESGSQPRPAVLSGYFKQFQKSLPPRFQRQQVTKNILSCTVGKVYCSIVREII